MDNAEALHQAFAKLREGKVRPHTPEQAQWVKWYESRFESIRKNAKSDFEAMQVDMLAPIELLTLITKFVDHAAYGIGLTYVQDGVLKRKLSRHETSGGCLAQAVAKANVRAGDDTATFMESLLRQFQSPDGLPEDIRIVAERYEGFAPWKREAELSQHDFDYFVIIPFPT